VFNTRQQWGKQQRRACLAGMQRALERLAENPSLAARRAGFAPPMRIPHPYEKHLLVYTIQERAAQQSAIPIVRGFARKPGCCRPASAAHLQTSP
jgi:plasmid stabilization system protein ParE